MVVLDVELATRQDDTQAGDGQCLSNEVHDHVEALRHPPRS